MQIFQYLGIIFFNIRFGKALKSCSEFHDILSGTQINPDPFFKLYTPTKLTNQGKNTIQLWNSDYKRLQNKKYKNEGILKGNVRP